MIEWIKKWWRLVRYSECPRCGCTKWKDEGGMGADWSECVRCGFARGYDGYTDHMARPQSFTGNVTLDYTKLGPDHVARPIHTN